jgi:REP element-mobilizing transposase RayT
MADEGCAVEVQTGKRSWLLTWTTKGTWLPGDRRGWVKGAPGNQPGSECEAGDEGLRTWSLQHMTGGPVWLTQPQAESVMESFKTTAVVQGWWLGAAAVMANHVHLVVTVDGDPEPGSLMLRLKNYASRSLNKAWGKQDWWTALGSTRKLETVESINAAMRYVIEQPGALKVYQSDNPGLVGL